MLSDGAFDLLIAIREGYGADVKGVGPGSFDEIMALAEADAMTTKSYLLELKRLGFVGIDDALGGKIIGCRIMEPGQAFLDQALDE